MKREEMIAKMREVLAQNGIRTAYLFGSFARGERHYKDIDVAVMPPEGFSLLDMAGVQLELEDGIGKKIDLVSMRSIMPRLGPYIKADLVAIL